MKYMWMTQGDGRGERKEGKGERKAWKRWRKESVIVIVYASWKEKER